VYNIDQMSKKDDALQLVSSVFMYSKHAIRYYISLVITVRQ